MNNKDKDLYELEKRINIFHKDIIYLEKIYKLNSYQDSFHN